MADLIITKAVLEDSAAALQHIHDELDHQKSDDGSLAEIYGEHDLQKAMHDFSGDWKIHRGKIRDAVGKLNESMQKSLESWTGLEKGLTDALTTENTPTGPNGGQA
ncbi:hypothetical protein [Curtobacterium sp. Leaf261]|uniref:hypothetical protein n=1 Tax=Curtobacterium sp. Leaf261 TaxID=1736311 RepID=UPI0006FF4190|nr:hypothetical protein [Curtobacterium sp. Leaf261]KQO63865.1 hypothetical protein ASF23_06690 [Curtobacterium sp. Leaf261]